MPAPIDLVGRRFGKLTVVARREKLYKGFMWRCQCDCGRQEDIQQWRLPYCESNRARRSAPYECATCRHTRVCVVCSAPFLSVQPRNCCSDTCQSTYNRRAWLEEYRLRLLRDPDFNRKRAAQMRELYRTCPAFVDYCRRYKAAWRKRLREDPEAYRRYKMRYRPIWREYKRKNSR